MQLTGRKFNQYLLTRPLRRGGMGDVYRAHDTKLDREVAVKVMRTDTINYADDEEAREAARLFLREAQVVARLDHRHILPLYDADEVRVDNMTLMYMVMPLRDEGSLTDWLRQYKGGIADVTLPPQYVERIIRHAAGALQYAHDSGIVHKDVKLSNFLVRDPAQHPGQLYLELADFGVARLMNTTSHSLIIRGTTSHMPPEQWIGKAVPASDQYSLAVMACELLTGQLPFHGDNNQQLWYQHTNVPPPAPSSINPAVPVELDAVLLRALAKAPQARYSSITVFAHAFHQALLDANKRVQQTQLSLYHDIEQIETAQFQPTVAIPEAQYDEQNVQPARRSHIGLRAVLLAALALMLIGAGVIAASLFLAHPSNSGLTDNKRSQASPTSNLTATQHVYATTTAQASATSGTRAISETATTQAINNAGATATAVEQANATATAQVSATAQANSQATATITAYDKTATAGTVSFDDHFQNSTDTQGWDNTYNPTAGGCEFAAGGYFSSITQQTIGTISPCFAKATQDTDFFYEVHLRIIKGDQGGQLFRCDSSNGNYYYFWIDTGGNYELDTYVNNSFSSKVVGHPSAFINTALDADNILAVQVKGSTIALFVNGHLLTTINDSTFSAGQVGVAAAVENNPTDVMFTEAKLSTL